MTAAVDALEERLGPVKSAYVVAFIGNCAELAVGWISIEEKQFFTAQASVGRKRSEQFVLHGPYHVVCVCVLWQEEEYAVCPKSRPAESEHQPSPTPRLYPK